MRITESDFDRPLGTTFVSAGHVYYLGNIFDCPVQSEGSRLLPYEERDGRRIFDLGPVAT